MRFLTLFFLIFTSVHAQQVVLITGASRGIGYAITEKLVESKYIVYAGARETSIHDPLKALQDRFPDNLNIISLDVTDSQSVKQAVAQVFDREGRIDALINNAGIMMYGSLENLTLEEARRIFEVNLFGAIRTIQEVLPIMRKQNKGRIVQISSRSGFRPLPTLSLYAASKFALEGLSETMAASLKPWNIFVSLIEPGPVATELDFISPYGSRLERNEDPYYPIFEASGLLDPVSPLVQQPGEIADFVRKALEDESPRFRYQTTPAIERQAAQRLVDITGLQNLAEWEQILFPSQ
jgi:NAD(P)-dependent dehydrogenase (short-subunit alcohol dehydrogenase family)